MKLVYGFWLIIAYILFSILFGIFVLRTYLLPYSVSAIVRSIVDVGVALGFIYMGLSKAFQPKYRVVLFLASIGVGLGPLFSLGWWYVTSKGYSEELRNALLSWGRIDTGVLLLAAIILGLASTTRRSYRLLLVGAILSYGAVIVWGETGLAVIALLVGGGIFLGIYGIFAYAFWKAGEEDARLMAEGRPPKFGPPPFGPNDPFKK